MPLAVDDVIQVTYEGVLLSQKILTVLTCRVKTVPAGTPTTENVLQDLADKMSANTFPLTQAYLAAACNEFNLQSVKVQRIKPTRTIYFRATIGEVGSAGTGTVTPNIAASIEKRSLKTDRKGIGRVQFGPLPEDAVGSGFIQSGWLGGPGQDFAEKLYGSFSITGLYAADYTWCLPAGGTDHDYDVWDAIIQGTIRTMHRRTVGLGI